ncbi:MAG TPA: hypothetical protein VFB84_12495 [Micromonosporaceae bacterium]|nr:hypothetical protein [Micromonosporaceae bacterium]
MVDYLLIESTGPQAGPGGQRFLDDAAWLARGGEQVTVLLVDNGVAGAVGVAAAAAELLRAGGTLWVDDFSLRQRALAERDLVPGVQVVGIADVARRLLADGVRAVWH